jgi:hypothetical protein
MKKKKEKGIGRYLNHLQGSDKLLPPLAFRRGVGGEVFPYNFTTIFVRNAD